MKSRTLSLSAIPFLRLLIPFAGGVLLFHAYPYTHSLIIPALLSLTGLLLFLCFRKKDSSLRTCSFFFFGCFAALASGAFNMYIHSAGQTDKPELTGFWNAGVSNIISSAEGTTHCEVNLYSFRASKDDLFVSKREKARLVVRNKSAHTLNAGDRISFYATLAHPANNGNPGEFDYAGWLLRKGITRSGFVDSSLWQSTPDPSPALVSIMNHQRDILKLRIQNLLNHPEDARLLIALLLGDKSELDEQDKLLFRRNGISHLLAVSGFHVGLIYSILLAGFFFVSANSLNGKLIRIAAVMVLWLYALLAGATPSVLRATFMITLFVAGSLTGRKSYPLNTLCFAAFCLLIIQPCTLWDIGFQLSVLAVAGILLAHHLLSEYLTKQNAWLRKAISFVSICTAAQIATLPLTLFYFGSYSPYFLIGNLIAIPLIYSALFITIPYLIIHLSLGFSSVYINDCIRFLFKTLSHLLGEITRLPYASPDTVRLHPEQVILLYLLLLCIVCCFFFRKKAPGISGIICFLLLFLPYNSLKQDARAQVIILNNTPAPVLFLKNGSSYSVLSTLIRDNEREMAEKYFSSSITDHRTFSSCITVANKRILFLDTDSLRYAHSPAPLPVDFLILKRGCKGDLTKINALFTPQMLLLDGSLSTYWRNKWIQEATVLGIPYYNMKENGAFSYFFH